MKKLSVWAKENNIPYATAYNWFKNNKLPVQAEKNAGGSIFVSEGTNLKEQLTIAPKRLEIDYRPVSVPFSNGSKGEIALASETRRNAASTITRTDAYKNISDGISPFQYGGSLAGNGTNVTVRDAIILCQKAYYNFSIFRNVIDLMTEISVGNIFFKGGSKKSRNFFNALWDKHNIIKLQEGYFKEYYRGANVFILRLDGLVDTESLSTLQQALGKEMIISEAKELKLPVKYIILNPADIQVGGNVIFSDNTYFKALNPFEIAKLKNPQTDEEISLFNALDSETQKKLKSGGAQSLLLPLDPNKLSVSFYKKQDYEPLAIPFGFAVLEDINWKAELKKMDMAVARTMQQVILLITVGSEMKDGSLNINQAQINAVKELFENESVGRVLVSDFTTKASFVIPQIGDILDPKKYQVVNEDIRNGLNNILIGDEKFSSQSVKVKVFVERLHLGRHAFLNDFLIPEIKRIAKEAGLQNYPKPYYQKINLENDTEYAKIYTRLTELGVLTPEESIKAIETGVLPTSEESVESQKELKNHKDEMLYQPIIGGKTAAAGGEAGGRPGGGTNAPKKMTPVGASVKFNLNKLKENLLLENQLIASVITALKKKHKLKKLNPNQESIATEIANLIVFNEPTESWLSVVQDYIDNPVDKNQDRVNAIHSYASEYGTTPYLAALLYNSKENA